MIYILMREVFNFQVPLHTIIEIQMGVTGVQEKRYKLMDWDWVCFKMSSVCNRVTYWIQSPKRGNTLAILYSFNLHSFQDVRLEGMHLTVLLYFFMSEQSNGCGMTTISWLECKSYIMAISVCDILSSLSFLFIFNMLVPVILVGKEVVLVMNLQKRPKSINFFFVFWIFALSLVFPAQNKLDIRLSGLLAAVIFSAWKKERRPVVFPPLVVPNCRQKFATAWHRPCFFQFNVDEDIWHDRGAKQTLKDNSFKFPKYPNCFVLNRGRTNEWPPLPNSTLGWRYLSSQNSRQHITFLWKKTNRMNMAWTKLPPNPWESDGKKIIFKKKKHNFV